MENYRVRLFGIGTIFFWTVEFTGGGAVIWSGKLILADCRYDSFRTHKALDDYVENSGMDSEFYFFLAGIVTHCQGIFQRVGKYVEIKDRIGSWVERGALLVACSA